MVAGGRKWPATAPSESYLIDEQMRGIACKAGMVQQAEAQARRYEAQPTAAAAMGRGARSVVSGDEARRAHARRLELTEIGADAASAPALRRSLAQPAIRLILDTPAERLQAGASMRSRRYAIWQKVAALAPVALLLVSLPSQLLLRCRIDGSLREACCCPADERQEIPGPVANAQDCCDREVTASGRPPFEAARGTEPDVVPAVSAVAPFAFATPSTPAPRIDRAWFSHGPPREGPTVVLLKHAFLI